MLSAIAPQALSAPDAASVRRILEEVMRGDEDFEAFCLDYFPDVHKKFSSSMNRKAKSNLLFQIIGHDNVYERLVSVLGRDPYQGIAIHTNIPELPITTATTKLANQLVAPVKQGRITKKTVLLAIAILFTIWLLSGGLFNLPVIDVMNWHAQSLTLIGDYAMGASDAKRNCDLLKTRCDSKDKPACAVLSALLPICCNRRSYPECHDNDKEKSRGARQKMFIDSLDGVSPFPYLLYGRWLSKVEVNPDAAIVLYKQACDMTDKRKDFQPIRDTEEKLWKKLFATFVQNTENTKYDISNASSALACYQLAKHYQIRKSDKDAKRFAKKGCDKKFDISCSKYDELITD